MKRLIASLLCCVCGTCIAGCLAPANPTTELHGGAFGWGFKDNKDNNILVENFSASPETKAVSFDKLEIRNNASDVWDANSRYAVVWNEQMKTANEGIKIGFEGVTNLANAIVPIFGQLAQQQQAVNTQQCAINATLQAMLDKLMANKDTQQTQAE